MTYFKALASAAAGFILARLVMSVAIALASDPISASTGIALTAMHAVLWVGFAAGVAIAWGRWENRPAADSTEMQDAATPVAG